MIIPDSITVNTGEQEEAYSIMSRFFSEVKSEIEKKVKIEEGPSQFRINVRNLSKLVAENPLASDDFAHMLFYKNSVVAAVLETRTDSNYIHFDYFFNSKSL